MVIVYLITCLPSNRKYIGITKNLRRRWNDHVSAATRGDHPNIMLRKSIQKHGRNAFSIATVYEAVTWREAEAVERGLIAAYGTLVPNGMNMTSGGGGTVDFHKPHSPETRAKIGAANKGRIQSTEARLLISAANKGRKRSAEVRAKMGAARIGSKRPDATKEKMAKSRRAYWDRWREKNPRPKVMKQTDEPCIYWCFSHQTWAVEIVVGGKKMRAPRCKELSDAIKARDMLRAGIRPEAKQPWRRSKNFPLEPQYTLPHQDIESQP
jgi:group I intron endonuclease